MTEIGCRVQNRYNRLNARHENKEEAVISVAIVQKSTHYLEDEEKW